MWICRFSRDHRAGQVSAADPDVRRGTADAIASAPAPKRYRLAPLAVLGELNRDAGSAEQARAWFRRSAATTRPASPGSAGDRAQDFGAGGLAIPGGAQFSLQPGNRFVALGRTSTAAQARRSHAQIGHHVLGKRGHSLKSISPVPGCQCRSGPSTSIWSIPFHGASGQHHRGHFSVRWPPMCRESQHSSPVESRCRAGLTSPALKPRSPLR